MNQIADFRRSQLAVDSPAFCSFLGGASLSRPVEPAASSRPGAREAAEGRVRRRSKCCSTDSSSKCRSVGPPPLGRAPAQRQAAFKTANFPLVTGFVSCGPAARTAPWASFRAAGHRHLAALKFG